jgi:pantoate--beta-alanine ligase
MAAKKKSAKRNPAAAGARAKSAAKRTTTVSSKKAPPNGKASSKASKAAQRPTKAAAKAAGTPGPKRSAKKLAKTPRRRASSSPGELDLLRDREPRLVESATMMQAFAMATRTQGRTIGFVPTMGALHLGHRALLREARQRADIVVASIFVNPLQFGPSEDLSRYPRNLENDVDICRAEGVDIIFAPPATEMYPEGFQTHVRSGPLSTTMEGASRPTHFEGMLTVVNLLFQIVRPHFAVFGEKDYQQLSLVRRMVRDLRVPVEVVPIPVIRDVDGLALSSRNAYLNAEERQRATCLYRALMAAQDEAQSGEVSSARFIAAARAVLDETPGFATDYVEVRDPLTLEPMAELTKTARILMAGKLGPVRLLDNGPIFAGVRRSA